MIFSCFKILLSFLGVFADKMFRDSQRISTISDDEPLYDSVASDEDYSSIDTQSIKSVREEMRPDITAEVRGIFSNFML